MNSGCCYTFRIRQLTCQNGISRNFDNSFTNLTNNTDIDLNFGYTLRFLHGNNSTATISIGNEQFLPETTFNVPNGSYRVFDLPCECGTYRVFISAELAPCGVSSLCCAD